MKYLFNLFARPFNSYGIICENTFYSCSCVSWTICVSGFRKRVGISLMPHSPSDTLPQNKNIWLLLLGFVPFPSDDHLGAFSEIFWSVLNSIKATVNNDNNLSTLFYYKCPAVKF